MDFRETRSQLANSSAVKMGGRSPQSFHESFISPSRSPADLKTVPRLYRSKRPKQRNCRLGLSLCDGAKGARTPDLLTASQVLSQLSYRPVRANSYSESGRGFYSTRRGVSTVGARNPQARRLDLGPSSPRCSLATRKRGPVAGPEGAFCIAPQTYGVRRV